MSEFRKKEFFGTRTIGGTRKRTYAYVSTPLENVPCETPRKRRRTTHRYMWTDDKGECGFGQKKRFRNLIKERKYEESYEVLTKMAKSLNVAVGDCTYLLKRMLYDKISPMTKWSKQNLAKRVLQLCLDNNIRGSNGLMTIFILIQRDTKRMPPASVLIKKITDLRIQPNNSLLALITRAYARLLSCYQYKENIAHFYATQTEYTLMYMVNCVKKNSGELRIQSFVYNTVLEMWYRMYCIANKVITKNNCVDLKHWTTIKDWSLESFWNTYHFSETYLINIPKDPFTYELALRMCLLIKDKETAKAIQYEFDNSTDFRKHRIKYTNPLKSIDVINTLWECNGGENSSSEEEEALSIYQQGKKFGVKQR